MKSLKKAQHDSRGEYHPTAGLRFFLLCLLQVCSDYPITGCLLLHVCPLAPASLYRLAASSPAPDLLCRPPVRFCGAQYLSRRLLCRDDTLLSDAAAQNDQRCFMLPDP